MTSCPACSRDWPSTLDLPYKVLARECRSCWTAKHQRQETAHARHMSEGEARARADLARLRAQTPEERAARVREDAKLWG